MAASKIRVIVLGLALLTAPWTAAAQMVLTPPPHIQTLELSLVQASTVVTGSVVDVQPKAGTVDNWLVTVAVTETLRGRQEARLTIESNRSTPTVEGWRRTSAPLLISVPADRAVPATIVDLADPELAVMTADLMLLRTPGQVIDATREIVRAAPAASKPATFGVAFEATVVAGTSLDTRGRRSSLPAAFLFADVPVGPRLESYAREQLRAAERERRINAIQALALFTSPLNIDLLRPLLDDEDWRNHYFDSEQDRKMRRVQYNDIRKEAYAVLRRLGVKVEEPETMRPRDPDAQVIAVPLDYGLATSSDVRELVRYPNLEDLYLSTQRLSDEDWAVIGRLRSLRALFLEGSNISDAGLARLAGLQNLEYLGLGNTAITDAGLLTLATMPRLKKVDLGQRLTEAGMAALRQRRPDLDVRPDEFAFLAPLRPRREDQPFVQMRNSYLPLYSISPEAAGLRVYVLIFPKDAAGQVDELLRRELPAHGWEPTGAPGYQRKGVPVVLGSMAHDVDEVFRNPYGQQWHYFTPPPGERLIVIVRNVAPRGDRPAK